LVNHNLTLGVIDHYPTVISHTTYTLNDEHSYMHVSYLKRIFQYPKWYWSFSKYYNQIIAMHTTVHLSFDHLYRETIFRNQLFLISPSERFTYETIDILLITVWIFRRTTFCKNSLRFKRKQKHIYLTKAIITHKKFLYGFYCSVLHFKYCW